MVMATKKQLFRGARLLKKENNWQQK